MTPEVTRHALRFSFLTLMMLAVVTACGGEAGGGKNTSGSEPETAQTAEPGTLFDESVKDEKCSLLTPAQVAAAASVPESSVEQNPALCLYEWENANIYLSSVRVHDSIERASQYYARNTEDFTAEEMHASKEKLKTGMQESDTGSGASEALIDAIPEVATTHQRWDDIGDEAAWDGNTTMIRYGNVTVKFSGKTYDRAEGEDWVAPEVARGVAEAIVSNLDEA